MAASLDYPAHQFNVQRRPLPSAAPPMDYLAHSRSRTMSSNIAPAQHYQHPQHTVPPPLSHSRRTLSNATTSTTSTHSSVHGRVPAAPSSYASSIRRSTSSRSNNSPTSYVSLMRKQKATVWCDRAQLEDPRILAQQRAAKVRAQMEVVGGVSATGNGRSAGSSGGIASKIRHHGAVKASAYSAAGNMSGGGVPMRLSASEVDEDNSDDDSAIARYHQRNNSGRSSLGSGQRTRESYYAGPTPTATRFSNGSTPPSNNSYSPVDKYPEQRDRQDSIATTRSYSDATPQQGATRNDYFTHPGGNGGSSGSIQEERFGDVGSLPTRAAVSHNYGIDQQKTNDELRRRGSVDDRTTTMSGVRLFVANPDMDDD
ncbi:hypothetical protein E4T42_09217 [Aureobasidium subglaciale]|uniref:Uncharacterized protein n=1 Tax=Aureobasidium subglaciale (strain EXF-2481) TaxID=1043005 RepID=A0A074YLA7_AURSE|nr:uncharacterized protein AUEXF2481DRAFT_225791 [Aureobasidium subglaciale EXF-2481]KAI5197298.1 hypothetical protein E4T38_08037 [Aureobasidium subglaciale]KAI5216237.1 hypothetical protein E4T40_08047 [Aureobasidium subglaciale]KAI5219440.1 hypothetical protein E4T41_07962 [Aureobasidium subglaciale]KAI5237498.1 hypothetical protein E4T42_09217 [Aureobasidium subglaciale]KAI5256870.1 hypothetical protein E4T46_07938 [Aureobasidium subglaciale]